MIERLDDRAAERIAGAAWVDARPTIEAIHKSLILVDPSVTGELTTIYVKYRSDTQADPFAVLWIKSSKKIVLGLSLPDEFEHGVLSLIHI